MNLNSSIANQSFDNLLKMNFPSFFSLMLDALALTHFEKEFIPKINLKMSYCLFQPLKHFNPQGDLAKF